jgi:hypothetical protein
MIPKCPAAHGPLSGPAWMPGTVAGRLAPLVRVNVAHRLVLDAVALARDALTATLRGLLLGRGAVGE